MAFRRCTPRTTPRTGKAWLILTQQLRVARSVAQLARAGGAASEGTRTFVLGARRASASFVRRGRETEVDPTEILVAEHRVIRSGLYVLLRMARRVERGPPTGREREIVAFLRQYADLLHHDKEHRILFPALAELGLPGSAGPLANLLHGHEIGRRLLSSMDRAIDEGLAAASATAFVSAASEYCQLMRRHSTEEERHIFPIARARLPAHIRRTLAEAMRAHRLAHAAEQERCLAQLEPLISLISAERGAH